MRLPIWSSRIVVPIYDFKLWLGYAREMDDFRGTLPESLRPIEEDDRFGNAVAQSFYVGKSLGIVFTSKDFTRNTVAHEVFHGTHDILKYIGDRFSANHPEPGAYLNGWLTEQVYRFFDKHRLKPA